MYESKNDVKLSAAETCLSLLETKLLRIPLASEFPQLLFLLIDRDVLLLWNLTLDLQQ